LKNHSLFALTNDDIMLTEYMVIMGESMAKKPCSVEGCSNESVHELSYVDAKILEEKLGLKLKVYHAHPPRRPGIVYLCEEHYKLWKKLSKPERKIKEMTLKS